MTTPTSASANSHTESNLLASQEAFAMWSQVYDHQVNPLLCLEERYLLELLPPLTGLDVVDIGCGTGRWLERFASRGPSSLTGVDSSTAMVNCARRKLGPSATVMVGDAESLPLSNSCADLVVASFVASYVPDLFRLAAEVRRIVRPGAQVFLSDLHPATASAYMWKRGFRFADTEVELASYARTLSEVVDCFEAFGFEAALLLEPRFGSAERDILRAAGKVEVFHAVANQPAIYLLQLRRRQDQPRSHPPYRPTQSSLEFSGARVAIGPNESIHGGIAITAGQIAKLNCSHRSQSRVRVAAGTTVDVSGYLVLPGLTNSHDHLEFGLFPNLGSGPYANFEQWAEEIHRNEKAVIDRQCRVPKDVRLWWGAIRNLLCGVTTVCHHNPISASLLDDDFPVRVMTELGWAHSVALEPQLSTKLASAPKGRPFVLHAAEGVDAKSSEEIFYLDRISALNEFTVLAHGLALDPDGLALINRRGASLVWCPTSNHFLFGRTHNQRVLSSVERVVLGSDSPLTSAGDLLDEIRYAYEETHVAPEELYRMVITRPPSVFRLTDGRGAIRPGAAADLIAVRDTGKSPAETLVTISSDDVELVVIGGRVQLASQAVVERLSGNLSSGLHPLDVDGRVRWIRAPLGRLWGIATEVLGCDITLGGKEVRHVSADRI